MELFLELLDSEVFPEMDDESKHLHNAAYRARLEHHKIKHITMNTRGSKAWFSP